MADSAAGGSTSRMAFTCRWVGCTRGFENLDELVVHLDEAHVSSSAAASVHSGGASSHSASGGGSSGTVAATDRKLRCFWEGCWRDAPYTERTKLVQHLRAHTGEKPFQCPVRTCLMRFSVRSNFVAHGKRRHGRMLTPIIWSARKWSNARTTALALQPSQVNIARTDDGNYKCNEGPCTAQFKTYASAVDHRLSTHVFVSILQAQPSAADGVGQSGSPGDDGDNDGDNDGNDDEDDEDEDGGHPRRDGRHDTSENGQQRTSSRARLNAGAVGTVVAIDQSVTAMSAAPERERKRLRVDYLDQGEPAAASAVIDNSPQRPGLHMPPPPSSLLPPGWLGGPGSRHDLPAVSFDGRTLPGMAPHAGHLFTMVDGRLLSVTDGGMPVYLVSGHGNAHDDLLPGATAIPGGWPSGPLPPLPPLPPTAGTPTAGAPTTAASTLPWGPFYSSPAAVHHPASVNAAQVPASLNAAQVPASLNAARDPVIWNAARDLVAGGASPTPTPQPPTWSTLAPSYPKTAPTSSPVASPVRRASTHLPPTTMTTPATTQPPTMMTTARPLAGESASAAVTTARIGGGGSTRRRSSSSSDTSRRNDADAASSVDSSSKAAELEAHLQALTAQGARLRHYQIYMMSMSREVHSIQGRVRPQTSAGDEDNEDDSESEDVADSHRNRRPNHLGGGHSANNNGCNLLERDISRLLEESWELQKTLRAQAAEARERIQLLRAGGSY